MFPVLVLLVTFLTLLGCDGQNGVGCDDQSNDTEQDQSGGSTENLILYPANNLQNVNPDVHLKMTFPSAPPLSNQGTIRVYDASNDQLVDKLDLSIAPGPENSRMPAPYDQISYSSSQVYQEDFMGGQSSSYAYHLF